MEITAGMVKALRDKTGLSMMECKTALVESGGDEAKAIELLRKKGLAAGAKRAGNVAGEGRVAVEIENGRGGIAEVRCETAPVSNTDDFIDLTRLVARQAARLDNPTPADVLAMKLIDDPAHTVQERFNEVFNRLREKLEIARVGNARGSLGSYVHHNGQVGALIEFSGTVTPDMATDIAMHVVAMRPACASREEVDKALVEQERRIAADQIKDKPANIIDKIVEGKLGRWFSEIVLHEQPFVKDDKRSVGQVLDASCKGVTVKRFLRYQVGEQV